MYFKKEKTTVQNITIVFGFKWNSSLMKWLLTKNVSMRFYYDITNIRKVVHIHVMLMTS